MGRFVGWDVRAAAYDLMLLEGVNAVQAAARLGVGVTAVWKWADDAGMSFLPARSGGGVVAAPIRDDLPGAYRRLTLADRALIQAHLELPVRPSLRRIASVVGVNVSTISRELARHSLPHRGETHYSASAAHYRAMQGRGRFRQGKLTGPDLRGEVVSRLNLRFSPVQVAGQLRRDFPGRTQMQVSHETIYQALYVQGRGALRHELTVEKALRSGRSTRKPQSKLPPRSSRPWLDGARLTNRPAEVADRAVPGHWEGDLVVGPCNSGIVTLVERQTRFALLGRLPGARDSATVTEVLAGMIQHLPHELTRSITWDQGTEMARHAQFTVKTGCPVFFCDPHSPWQRGSNENLNGLIRDIHPKGTNFNTLTDADLAHTQWLLNIRPRQTLNFNTPAAMLNQLINRVALAT